MIFFSHECSPYRRDPSSPSSSTRTGKSEELLDSFLLIGRNAAQMIRLLSVVRRSSNSVTNRVSDIDIDSAQLNRNRELSFSLDIDLEDEGARVRDRMADGGDQYARRKRDEWRAKKGGEREEEPLFEVDEDEDDEL